MKWVRYLIYGVAFTACIFISGYINSQAFYCKIPLSGKTVFFISILTAFVFGILLGLEHLIEQANNKKSPWTYNVPRIVFMGIPSFLITLFGVITACRTTYPVIPELAFNNKPMNAGTLYPATQIIDTFVYNSTVNMSYPGMIAATGIFHSIYFFQFGALLLGYVILSNFEKKKI